MKKQYEAIRRLVFRVQSLLGLALLMTVASSGAHAQQIAGSPQGRESVAAFLLNFGRHLEWPAAAFSGADFRVCVLGQNELGRELTRALEGNSAGSRAFTIVELAGDQVSQATGCQIVYISSSESANVAGIIGALDGSPVLTVAAISDFPENGGMVGLANKGANDVALRMHRRKIEESGLTINDSLRDALASL